MNFLEAAEIARKNPGSHFTRGESGLFVVYLKDGQVISSPEQCYGASSPRSRSEQPLALDNASQLRELPRIVASLERQLETSNIEIRQLRHEVNSLKEAIAKVPESEWSRYEEERQKLEQQRQAEERDHVVGLARGERAFPEAAMATAAKVGTAASATALTALLFG